MSSPKVWLITGCSSGFGDALALEVLSRGEKCIATARNVEQLDYLEQKGAEFLQLDVTASLLDLQKKAEQAIAIYGRIDFLINNAGYILGGTVEESTPEETQAQFDTNVFGVFNVTRAFLPVLRKQRSGVIGVVSSIGAWGGWAGSGNYCSSKWAISGFAESLASEVAEFGIKVCSIEPGYFRSRLLNETQRKGGDERRIADYAGTAAEAVQNGIVAMNSNQPGDVHKGAKVIYDVLSGQGGKEVPVRLALGPDAYAFIKNKCEETLALLEDWKDVTCSTNRDGVM